MYRNFSLLVVLCLVISFSGANCPDAVGPGPQPILDAVTLIDNSLYNWMDPRFTQDDLITISLEFPLWSGLPDAEFIEYFSEFGSFDRFYAHLHEDPLAEGISDADFRYLVEDAIAKYLLTKSESLSYGTSP